MGKSEKPRVIKSTRGLSPTALRKKLHEVGYEPLPNVRKVCYLKNWSETPITEKEIKSWPSNKWLDTGIRTGAVVFIDVDVEDEFLQELIELIISDVVGELSQYIRVGNPARKGYVYRQVDPDPKAHKKVHTGKWIYDESGQGGSGELNDCMVEILRYGQQFGAYGRHSDEYNYDWPQKNLLDCKKEDLPSITDDQVFEIIKKVEAQFRNFELKPKSKGAGSRRRPDKIADDKVADVFAEVEAKRDNLDEICAALKSIDPSDYETWRTVGMAMKVTQHPDALGVWDSWSQGGNYPVGGERTCKEVWASFENKATTSSVTVGTIFQLARANGWDGSFGNKEAEKQLQERIEKIKKDDVKIDWESVVELLGLAIKSGADDGKIREILNELSKKGLMDVDYNHVKKKVTELRSSRAKKTTEEVGLEPPLTNVPRKYNNLSGALRARIARILPDIVLTARGTIAAEQPATSGNILAVLKYAGVELRHNEMAHTDETEHSITDCPLDGLALINDLCLYARIKSANKVGETVEQIAWNNRYYPPAVWLRILEWDGKSRMKELFESIQFESHVNSEYAYTVLRKWLIQCVAGALSEGPVQLSHVLVLTADEGGEGKSEWFRSLVPVFNFFQGEQGFSGGSNQADDIMRLTGSWITELAEMEGTWRRRDVTHVKAFLSAVVDVYRIPYGRTVLKRQRRTSFCGSSNESENLLADRSGANRRFWVLNIRRCNFNHGIDMTQVWAEIVTYFDAGEQWWLNAEEQAMHRAEADKALMLNEYDDYLDHEFGEFYDPGVDPDSWTFGAIRATDLVEMQASGYHAKVTQSALNQAGKALRRRSEFGVFDRISGSDKRRAYKIRVKMQKPEESGAFWSNYIDVLPN